VGIPVIDIFAGPGGLGEGFTSVLDENGERVYKIALSIEKDAEAHETLELRSFFRQFPHGNVPQDYYDFLKGDIEKSELYSRWPVQYGHAAQEAWHATLGEDEEAVSNREVDRRIDEALGDEENWLLIGGPPCQAYSVVGRVRRQENVLDERTDERVGLYKQYLRILAVHNPAVFVMENVKGLLSAKTKNSSVFAKILQDLADPVRAYLQDYRRNGRELNCPGYRIYSLTQASTGFDENGKPIVAHKSFVIKAEKYGIPQTRHRVILLGVREDIDFIPATLEESRQTSIAAVLAGLPRLRSGLTKSKDNGEGWLKVVREIEKPFLLSGVDKQVKKKIRDTLARLTVPQKERGGEYINQQSNIAYRPDWYIDPRMEGVCNHSSRSHMPGDIFRYLFVSCFAKVHKRSPTLEDFPHGLLPDHLNVNEGIEDKKFADRFRVQLSGFPSKTITSHISKDGHYYIHPDPTQCRSFTVREAARIQSFPDNYYFCGTRTSQFTQVGNAVPPLLANQIAHVVKEIFDSIINERNHQYTQRLQNV
jgi:DNA (cytosine-5)-methyltransferase 1